jgi:SPW repeat-containing protein
MLREGPIPQAVQGLLEYLAGIAFIAAPFVLDFTGNGTATAAAIVVGIVFLVLAATSQGPTGLVKQLSPPVHALLDAVLAILLVAAPFVLGFSADATPRNLFLVTGVVWLLVTIGSRYDRKERRTGATGGDRDVRRAPEVPAAPVTDPPGSGADQPSLGTGPAPGARSLPGTGPATGSVGPEFGPLDGGGTQRT